MSIKPSVKRQREIRGNVIIDNVKFKNHKYIVFKSFSGYAYRPKKVKSDGKFYLQVTTILKPMVLHVDNIQPRAKRVWVNSINCDVRLLLSSEQLGQCSTLKSYATLEDAEVTYEAYWIKKNL